MSLGKILVQTFNKDGNEIGRREVPVGNVDGSAQIVLDFQLELNTPPPPTPTASLVFKSPTTNSINLEYTTNNIPSKNIQIQYKKDGTNDIIDSINRTGSKGIYTLVGLEQNTTYEASAYQLDSSGRIIQPRLAVAKFNTLKAESPPSSNVPSLKINPSSINFDITNRQELKIQLTELSKADQVHITNPIDQPKGQHTYSKSNVKQGDYITISTDFINGIGQHKVLLNAVNRNEQPNVSGGYRWLTINAIDPNTKPPYIPPSLVPEPEPEIPPVVTPPPPPPPLPIMDNIRYPNKIMGADYRGFNTDFSIIYSSQHATTVDVSIGREFKQFGTFGTQHTLNFNIQDLMNKGFSINPNNTSDFSFWVKFLPKDGNRIGEQQTVQITYESSPLQLTRKEAEDRMYETIKRRLDLSIFDEYNSKHLTHIASFDNDDFTLISNWDTDDVTFTEFTLDELGNEIPTNGEIEESLVLKLYEPLPTDITPNSQLWISKIKSTPYIDQVVKTEHQTESCMKLKPANFDVVSGDSFGYEIFNDIIGSGSVSSTELINKYIDKSGIDTQKLEIIYADDTDILFSNFVHFGSAEEQVVNSMYKIKVIESVEERITELEDNVTGISIERDNEVKRLTTRINEIKGGFSGFENFIYNNTHPLSYPKQGNGDLLNSTNSTVVSWYNGMEVSAKEFDKNNSNKLSNNLPNHIKIDTNNEEFLLFFDMIGQHYDILWSYINTIKESKIVEAEKNNGIIDDLVYHMVSSFGWELNSSVAKQQLWELAFGAVDPEQQLVENSAGSTYQKQIWRRILNNLPYLLKNKGTKRSIHAILSTYGIPQSLLTVIEFGGPRNPNDANTTQFTYDELSASLVFNGTSKIEVDWKEYNVTDGIPNGIELRVKTDNRTSQSLVQYDTNWNLTLEPSTGSEDLGYLQFEINTLSGSVSGSETFQSEPFLAYNNEYFSVLLNREVVGLNETFTVYGQQADQGRIKSYGSGSVSTQYSMWDVSIPSTIEIGDGFIGNIDEFRLWKVPLDKDRFNNHTLSPDSIDGNQFKSSTIDLIFRMDFEYPKNRGIDTEIKNVSPNFSYGEYGTAVGFPSITEYPYSHFTYDRTVTADIPSLGFTYSDKTRIEDIELISELSSKSRSTKKSFDRAPVDSNRLGLFFSPMKEVNMDIVKSFGSFNIDDYIGDPSDTYRDDYKELKKIRKYYFQRLNLDIYEYIRLIRYIDKSVFKMVENVIPSRTKYSKGLLIEPHFLERSKVRWDKPTAESSLNEAKVEVGETIKTIAEEIGRYVEIDASEEVNILTTLPSYEAIINEEDFTEIQVDYRELLSKIDVEDLTTVIGDYKNLFAEIDGIISPTITSEVDAFGSQTQIGMGGFENPAVGGFGIFGNNGYVSRVYRDSFNNIKREGLYVELFKERNIVLMPSGSELVDVEQFSYKLNTQPVSGSSPTSIPGDGSIVSIKPLEGYLNSHYKFRHGLSTGLERSYYLGSTNSSETTLDGSTAVEVFVTNPNTLRVSDSERGSGEPILIVSDE